MEIYAIIKKNVVLGGACLKSLKKEHFCYGAILSAIMEYNPDTPMVLLEKDENSRKIYKITTNTSQECIVFFKYAFEKTDGSRSWVYRFSDKDKEFLKNCYDNKIPTFIYLLCGVKTLKDSEIAVLHYDEYAEVSNKMNFTIGIKKNYPNFYLHRSQSPKDDIHIPRNRIEKDFDYLINNIIEISHGYYCPKCGTAISI